MSITRRTDYAIRMMYELARLPEDLGATVRGLCEAGDVPEAFGHPIAEMLTRARLVELTNESASKVRLARRADEITLLEIIHASEPDFSLALCKREPQECARVTDCRVHPVWVGLDRVIASHLGQVTLGSLVDESRGQVLRRTTSEPTYGRSTSGTFTEPSAH